MRDGTGSGVGAHAVTCGAEGRVGGTYGGRPITRSLSPRGTGGRARRGRPRGGAGWRPGLARRQHARLDERGGNLVPRLVPVVVVAPPEKLVRALVPSARFLDQRRLEVEESHVGLAADLGQHDAESRRR